MSASEREGDEAPADVCSDAVPADSTANGQTSSSTSLSPLEEKIIRQIEVMLQGLISASLFIFCFPPSTILAIGICPVTNSFSKLLSQVKMGVS